MSHGTLVLVVGPSGAGKDTLIRGARSALSGQWGFVFPRREVTRPAAAGGEDHCPISVAQFLEREARGAYSLSWEANGLRYGIPCHIEDSLAAGRMVVVNVSRGVIGEARRRYPRRRIFCVTAPAPVLMRRLLARGREAETEIGARLVRAAAFDVAGADVITLINDADAAQSTAHFVRLLREIRIAA